LWGSFLFSVSFDSEWGSSSYFLRNSFRNCLRALNWNNIFKNGFRSSGNGFNIDRNSSNEDLTSDKVMDWRLICMFSFYSVLNRVN
jgi:hypothetical protein